MKLTDAQVLLAAKYFTACNLGMGGKVKDDAGIESLYQNCKRAHEADGLEITQELREWIDEVRKGYKGSFIDNEIRKDIPFILEL